MNALLISRNLHTNTRVWPRRYWRKRRLLSSAYALLREVVITERFTTRTFELEG